MYRKRRKVRVMAGMLGMAVLLGMAPSGVSLAAEDGAEAQTETAGTSSTSGAMESTGESEMDSGEYSNGNQSDILVSNVNVTNAKAGGTVTVSFTVAGGKNTKKKYEVDMIEGIYPNIDSGSGFVKNSETSRVTEGAGNTLNCTYTFQTKETAETGYYPVNFSIVYTRKSTDPKVTLNNEYVVNKEFSAKITAKQKVEPTPTAEVSSADTDVYLEMKNSPSGVYGQSCRVSFVAKSKSYPILSVAPVVDNDFPFESSSDAYKVVRSEGTKRLACNYDFVVKSNVATGYQPITYEVTYQKGETEVSTKKIINVSLTGKKEEKDKQPQADKKKSTPRLMVIGYTTDQVAIKPGSTFDLNLQVKNNASATVRNIKFTLSTENGEFLPVSGASTAYVDSIASKGTATLRFKMKASAGLGSKSYPITVKSEYEDSQANAYDATDNVSIPITLEDRISLSDVVPASVCVGEEGDVSFSVNNMGAGTLSNVSATCEGEGIEAQEAYVGNIGSGSTEYVSVTITGTETTDEENGGKMNIVIHYENASGEEKTFTEEAEVYVMEAMDEEDFMDEEMMDEAMEEEKGFPMVPVIIGVIVVAVIILVVLKKRKKKKLLQLEQELIEDELP